MRAVVVFILLSAFLVRPARTEDRSLDPGERRAQAVYEKQVQRRPVSAAAQASYAEYLAEHGQLRNAITHWRLAQLLDPANGAIANSLGGAYLRIGQAAKSAEQFQRAVERASEVAAYHYNLANVEYLLRHELTSAWQIETAALLQRALAEYREASRLAPDNLEYARGYAETFYGIENPDWGAAEAAWKHVLALSPQGDFANLQLARVSLKRGDKAQVRLFLDRIRDARHDGLKRKLRDQADKL